MIVRVRCKDGTFRLDLDPQADAAKLGSKIVHEVPNVDSVTIKISNQPRGGETLLSTLVGRTIGALGLKHGDMIFASYDYLGAATTSAAPSVPNSSATAVPSVAAQTTSSNAPAKRTWEDVQEDPVDDFWRQKDGKIPRERDAQFCKHGTNAMCDYCMPLEPWDAKYRAEHSIKHLSYWAYLRSKTVGVAQSAPAGLPPLDKLSYRVKVPCPSGTHAPWPGGICSKCQTSAITLQPQSFRMVDHVEFSSSTLIDKFLSAWRKTGLQRFGILIGRYEPYPEVPMGIKAVVEAIHEPPQEGEVDGLTLGLPWEDESRVKQLAADCKGLQMVGVIFTDLTADETDRTKLICKRHKDSFWLSSLETSFAATLQLSHPNPSRAAPSGHFSSRFVTCVLSGTPKGDIDVSCYQASEQACAMVDADIIEASVEPGIVRVKEESASRYIPDVFFRYKNEYGLDVQQTAKPSFPVEYLLVNITHGFPTNPSPAFISTDFPIENRPGLEDQDMSKVVDELFKRGASAITSPRDARTSPATSQQVMTYLSDWHLLSFLGTVGVLSADDVRIMADAVTAPNLESTDGMEAIAKRDGWQTLMAIVGTHSPAIPTRPPPPSGDIGMDDEFEIPEDFDVPLDTATHGAVSGTKTCPHCTFDNPADATDCMICGLPMD
ncbi:polyubiquitin-tagged protein recognition complex Npl4 component [Dacryopinax primogenitus]|uniref:Nuclear protein localization protein 4 n=1 Tax=Dacryopinax primogenitus (strain DJM 731) TaxID=1858805 RepID=M5G7M6_DACPD|nr:polyubiquitin-tagged protein recognition complex Npl4 component [Dacryopinax primogenitus]EJT99782.1 polyubiquitin-tagged protein recognition complex Npl4 component [Dacryopinax primogenitus]